MSEEEIFLLEAAIVFVVKISIAFLYAFYLQD